MHKVSPALQASGRSQGLKFPRETRGYPAARVLCRANGKVTPSGRKINKTAVKYIMRYDRVGFMPRLCTGKQDRYHRLLVYLYLDRSGS